MSTCVDGGGDGEGVWVDLVAGHDGEEEEGMVGKLLLPN